MPNTTTLIETVREWLLWLYNCSILPMTAIECRPFWQSIIYAGAGIAVAVVAWVIWTQIDYKLKYATAMHAQADRKHITETAAMHRHKLKEAGDVAADVTDPHLAEKIRRELERQRQERIKAA